MRPRSSDGTYNTITDKDVRRLDKILSRKQPFRVRERKLVCWELEDQLRNHSVQFNLLSADKFVSSD